MVANCAPSGEAIGALSPRPRDVLALKGRIRRLMNPGMVKAMRSVARKKRRRVRGVGIMEGRLFSLVRIGCVKLVLVLSFVCRCKCWVRVLLLLELLFV